MQIEKIKITNFKCFNETFELQLNEKLNIIVGDNDSGKTTIVEAIDLTLTGWYRGKYIYNELTQTLFNKDSINEYLNSVREGNPIEPPRLTIELFFSDDTNPIFKGTNNSDKTEKIGVTFIVEFDDKYFPDYECLIEEQSIHSLPIEYYHYYWDSFARDERITPRVIPINSALIDSTSSRNHHGSDIYISKIVKNHLDIKDVVEVSQAHRKMKDVFMEQPAIININKKIKDDSEITDKNVELSVELSTKNAWENSLVTYIDEVPFNLLGKGEQSILKTKLALSHKKAEEANILLIEEPENHLSHSNLNTLLKSLGDNNENKQVIITTHSSYVANKLGLKDLILLHDLKTAKLSDLNDDTYKFFKKLSGYETLRLLLSRKAILVEGDSDELIVQKAYTQNHDNKLPIEDGIDVISVGTSFLRFLEIAEKITIPTTVVTDVDWSLEDLESKYENYLGDNKKDHILISYDAEFDEGELEINGNPFNYNTLEPKILKASGLELMNQVLDTTYETENELHRYMKSNKTKCALKIFESEEVVVFPEYIENAI